jgi:zinc/manganese transport system substrate-binding protein/manganese/iron transport system substrate-binding protein
VRVRPLSSLVVAAGLALAGCGASTGAADRPAQTVRVVATTTQVADFVRNVGGGRVSVTQLLAPEVNPHDYEASPADVRAIADADLVIKNGVGLETFLDRAISAAGFSGTVVDTSAGVRIRAAGKGPEAWDPHIWHNPLNAKMMAKNIAAALAAEDPAGRGTFEAGYAAYAGRLDALDRDVQSQIESLPTGARTLVTNHEAFGYYAERYGLKLVDSVIPSFDTPAEWSGEDITDLVAEIRATGVKVIFVNSTVPPGTTRAIGRDAGVTVIGDEDSLYAETLARAGEHGESYLRMVEHNTTTIVHTLSG